MADKDPIRVGILYSETGVTSTIGLSQLQGALLGIEEINAAGGTTAASWSPCATTRSRTRRAMRSWPRS